MFLLRLPGTTLVGSSPQGLVSVRDRQVITWAIAGTRPRGEDVETDAELAAELANDDKERAEHEMLVALARADIHAVAEPGSVHVTDRARIVRYAKVMHMVTEVTATLAADHDPLDALVAVFPSGTVSGTPREAALRIVEELEPQPRGLYGGAVGYLDFSGNLDTCIAIRALHLVDGMAYGQAGAGVIAGSDPELEVLESRAKAHAMFASLVMATALEG
jgi:anthranilate synthase component 1